MQPDPTLIHATAWASIAIAIMLGLTLSALYRR